MKTHVLYVHPRVLFLTRRTTTTALFAALVVRRRFDVIFDVAALWAGFKVEIGTHFDQDSLRQNVFLFFLVGI